MSLFFYPMVCNTCGAQWTDQGGMVGTMIMGPIHKNCPTCQSYDIAKVEQATP